MSTASDNYEAFLAVYAEGEAARREEAWKKWVAEHSQTRARVHVVYEDGTPGKSETMPYESAVGMIAREISGCGHHFTNFGPDERSVAGYWRGRRVMSAVIGLVLD